jgi:hypothetical protein
MNRQLTLRLFGIVVASLLFTVCSRNYYEHMVAELVTDPQAFLAHLTSLAQLGFGYRYFGAICLVGSICGVVELVARIADRIVPSRQKDGAVSIDSEH